MAAADKCSRYDSLDVALRDYKSRARNEPSRIFHKHKECPLLGLLVESGFEYTIKTRHYATQVPKDSN